jgi:CRISPR system Cascade subunit CasD
MSTLLLRLAAPLQAWGSSSKFDIRRTEREPTKCGVIGILAAALGRRRSDSIEDLSMLNYGVRIDQPGQFLSDFHTAHTKDKTAFLSQRYYLTDAVFLVGFDGNDELIERSNYALTHPAFPLYLGRRSCPPSGKLSLGIRYGKNLYDALHDEPWQASDWYQKNNQNVKLEIVYDVSPYEKGAFVRRDMPTTFNENNRDYWFRHIKSVPDAVCVKTQSEHDAFAELGGEQ